MGRPGFLLRLFALGLAYGGIIAEGVEGSGILGAGGSAKPFSLVRLANAYKRRIAHSANTGSLEIKRT